MNILFCSKCWMNPNEGGVGRVSDILAKYFVSEGHRLYYLNFEYDEKDNYIFPAEIFLLPDTEFFSNVNLDFYHNLLYQLSIDLIFNHDSSNNRSKFWLNTGKHHAKIISLHHNDPLYGLNRRSDLSRGLRGFLFKTFPLIFYYLKVLIKKREINYLLKKSDRLVLLSDEFKLQIKRDLKINSIKIKAINNPIISYNIQSSDIKSKQILFVARLELSQKRPDKMLKIWACLQNKYPDWKLLFLGDGPDRTNVEEMSKSMELKNVSFEGFVDPVPYYKESAILCMTSDYEGFGLVLPEAMQFGVVPITFNNWISLKDIIVDYETGILVRTDDLTDYVTKLDHLMSDVYFRNRISANAINHAKKFQIDKIGLKWIRLIEDVFKE